MSASRPYAIMQYLDALAVYAAAQKGYSRTEGYFMTPARYGSPETAWEQADYTNCHSGRHHPSYVVDTRTGKRVEHPQGREAHELSIDFEAIGIHGYCKCGLWSCLVGSERRVREAFDEHARSCQQDSKKDKR